MLLEEYQNMYIDLLKSKSIGDATIYNETCLNMSKRIKPKSVEGIIFFAPLMQIVLIIQKFTSWNYGLVSLCQNTLI